MTSLPTWIGPYRLATSPTAAPIVYEIFGHPNDAICLYQVQDGWEAQLQPGSIRLARNPNLLDLIDSLAKEW